MEDSREAWALAPRWRGEQRWHMDGPTPSLSTWTPGPSTTRTPASPAGSLPHQRQPAALGAMSRPGTAIVVTRGHEPTSRGVAPEQVGAPRPYALLPPSPRPMLPLHGATARPRGALGAADMAADGTASRQGPGVWGAAGGRLRRPCGRMGSRHPRWRVIRPPGPTSVAPPVLRVDAGAWRPRRARWPTAALGGSIWRPR